MRSHGQVSFWRVNGAAGASGNGVGFPVGGPANAIARRALLGDRSGGDYFRTRAGVDARVGGGSALELGVEGAPAGRAGRPVAYVHALENADRDGPAGVALSLFPASRRRAAAVAGGWPVASPVGLSPRRPSVRARAETGTAAAGCPTGTPPRPPSSRTSPWSRPPAGPPAVPPSPSGRRPAGRPPRSPTPGPCRQSWPSRPPDRPG